MAYHLMNKDLKVATDGIQPVQRILLEWLTPLLIPRKQSNLNN